MPDTSPAAPYRYLTLSAARALECNGCGDCCDSRRTDGFWTWGALPADGYASSTGGERLIIPLERVEGGWRDRQWRPEDEGALTPARFRCTAFEPTLEGGGRCARHDRWRPARCGEFPVWGEALEVELRERNEVVLQSVDFPRCTWYRVVVVRDGDARAGTSSTIRPTEG